MKHKKICKLFKKFVLSYVVFLSVFLFGYTVNQTNADERLEIKIHDIADEYFYNKIKISCGWDNILLTDEAASEKTMDEYTLKGMKPCIKYNYSADDNKLYIHAYLKFNAQSKSLFEIYEIDEDEGNHVLKETSHKSYKNMIIDGIEEYWSISITGDEYDFKPECNFETEVIVHTDGTLGQKYIHIKLDEDSNKNVAYVMNASVIMINQKTMEYNYNSFYDDIEMYINSNGNLAKDRDTTRIPYEDEVEFKRTVAHEFAHCLGISDAYDDIDFDSPKVIKRSYQTDETGWFEEDDRELYRNIMYTSRNSDHVTDNDLEMAIQAQAEAYHGIKNSWQSFVDYSDSHNGYTYNCKQSVVIRKKIKDDLN